MFVAYITDIGVKKSTNQDSLWFSRMNTMNGDACVAAVCDGMGGMERGEVASATLIELLKEKKRVLLNACKEGHEHREFERDIQEILLDATKRIQEFSHDIGPCGTTMVFCIVYNGSYFIANIGDSRAYLIRRDEMRQITVDHSYVQREIDAGRLTPEDAKVHPKRNVLLQCVGAGDGMYPDYFYGEANPGTTFLLCSDGFRHELRTKEIASLFNPGSILDDVTAYKNLEYCVEQIKERGEKDNITALIIRV